MAKCETNLYSNFEENVQSIWQTEIPFQTASQDFANYILAVYEFMFGADYVVAVNIYKDWEDGNDQLFIGYRAKVVKSKDFPFSVNHKRFITFVAVPRSKIPPTKNDKMALISKLQG